MTHRNLAVVTLGLLCLGVTKALTIRNYTVCTPLAIKALSQNQSEPPGITPNVSLSQALGMYIGFGVFAALLATAFNYIRRVIYNDKDSLDTCFDAGGTVSSGLTAATIVSQWTWAATLLQSCTVASKYGISGSFWYASGATIQILLFAIISLKLKIRAPGAKTFLQLIKARFDKKTHLTFCVFALLTNMIVTAMLMLGGAAVMTNLVKDLSVPYATMLTVAVICSYTFIGGLGATFYVSYFNTAFIFGIMTIFIIKIYNDEADRSNQLGSIEMVYNYVFCSTGPEDNLDKSYLTMISPSGLMFGCINIVGNFGTVFVDQSYWQSSVAAKPKQGVWGFLSGGMTWFAVPFTFSTSMGLAYLAISAEEGRAMLSPGDVDAGLVAPIVAQRLLGETGSVLMLVILFMAVISTGSAEVIAVTSIFVYDVYQIHINPFRAVNDPNKCILCGKARGRLGNVEDKCSCESMTFCGGCVQDDKNRAEFSKPLPPEFKCPTHGRYRQYNENTNGLKDWVMLLSTLFIIPLTLVLDALQVSLGWVYLFMGVVIGSAVVPLALCIFWSRLTGEAMMAGAIGGCTLGLTSWLTMAAIRPGGLSDFISNTGAETSMLVGNIVAIAGGAILTIVVTLVQNRGRITEEQEQMIWDSTRDIDNPLTPWTELYARELSISGAHQLDQRPSMKEVETVFRNVKITCYIGAIGLSLILVVIWPLAMLSTGTLALDAFRGWVYVAETWAISAAFFIIIVPLVNEFSSLRAQLRERKKVSTTDQPNANGHVFSK
ncbi:unnamed protein product [Owenia fusiformis]|uniref:Uncharacterized protein n=1 Tax=Owenia fusiformis TaxID=6347 RepID=A0A8J1XFV3_OWEFU|nr:unnamed protein product [Owenia fusiformis]